MSGDDRRDAGDRHDDPVARTIVDGTSFHRRRLAVGITRLSQRRKLTAFATTAGALALLFPIGLTLPPGVQDGYLGGMPLAASPAILVVGLVGLAAELTAGVVVTAVSFLARETSLTEREALQLVAVDNVATMVGLGVGTLAVLSALCGFGLGYAGVDAVRAFASPSNGVSGPYAPLPWLPSVTAVATAALGVGWLLALLAAVVEREL